MVLNLRFVNRSIVNMQTTTLGWHLLWPGAFICIALLHRITGYLLSYPSGSSFASSGSLISEIGTEGKVNCLSQLKKNV